jgi:hypothetical protein
VIRNLPFPKYISFNGWAAELIKIYRSERLPVPREAEEWQEWANKIAGIGVFRKNAVPAATTTKGSKKADLFKNWEDWARAVYIIMITSRDKQ